MSLAVGAAAQAFIPAGPIMLQALPPLHHEGVSQVHLALGDLGAQQDYRHYEIQPTFHGQNSPFLPSEPYIPNGTWANSYEQLLANSLYFYEVQRSGLLPPNNRVTWRNASGLDDGNDYDRDLTGGYYDAGDYLKFTFPLASSLGYLAWGGAQYADAFALSDQLGYLDQALRWGLDWMIKAHPDNGTLFVGVGDGDVDNNHWAGDLELALPRPSYQINSTHPGTDAAAGAAAAFASAAFFYQTTSPDPAYATRLLDHAVSLYNFALKAPRTEYHKSVPAMKEWYASSGFGDELVWASLHLFRATNQTFYWAKAEGLAREYDIASNVDPVGWDSSHGACMLLASQLVEKHQLPAALKWKQDVEAYLDAAMSTKRTPGGLMWFDGSSESASLVPAINTAYLLSTYALTWPDDPRAAKYLNASMSQVDYVLGNNPANRTFVVGAAPNSPQRVQSAMASGGHSADTIDSDPAGPNLRVLYGGVPGGPSAKDTYEDKRSNWAQSECALDYNALFTPLMAAMSSRGGLPWYVRQAQRPSAAPPARKRDSHGAARHHAAFHQF